MSYMIKSRKTAARLLAGFVFVAAYAGVALAADGPGTPGRPILTVSGNISGSNGNSDVVFDREMLESLGTVSFKTQTPWYDDPVEFEGVLMRTLLEAVGGESATEVTAIALNDYKSTIPVEDFTDFDVVLAIKRDGSYMPIRDKGPLFIVYPYDTASELATQKYFSRSAWQVNQLVVR